MKCYGQLNESNDEPQSRSSTTLEATHKSPLTSTGAKLRISMSEVVKLLTATATLGRL